jgi:hypothetical protein
MGILALAADERISAVDVSDEELSVRLRDGRKISVPLVWYPRLLHATDEQRSHWEIAGAGYGIRWEEIDEDLSVEGLLRGAPAPRSSGDRGETVRKAPLGELGRATETARLELVSESQDASDKGILDHVIEGQEAATELVEVLSWIQAETEAFTTKISKHTSNMNRLAKRPAGSTASDYNKVVLLAASDMNTFSRRVQEVLPRFATSTESLDQSYSAYAGFAKSEVPEDVERIGSLFDSLSQLLQIVTPAKEEIAHFRDSTRSTRKQNISKELNKAADLQWKILDSVLSETERVESFALKISFLINERFGQLLAP